MNRYRKTRLQKEYEELLDLGLRVAYDERENPLIEIEPIDVVKGFPPERYRVTYRCKGVVGINDDGSPIYGDEHQIEIHLGQAYPINGPVLTAITPLWHPDIDNLEPCYISYDSSSFNLQMTALGNLIISVGEMIQYKRYHAYWAIPYPLNKEAAYWVLGYAEPNGVLGKNNPIDNSNLLDLTFSFYKKAEPIETQAEEPAEPENTEEPAEPENIETPFEGEENNGEFTVTLIVGNNVFKNCEIKRLSAEVGAVAKQVAKATDYPLVDANNDPIVYTFKHNEQILDPDKQLNDYDIKVEDELILTENDNIVDEVIPESHFFLDTTDPQSEVSSHLENNDLDSVDEDNKRNLSISISAGDFLIDQVEIKNPSALVESIARQIAKAVELDLVDENNNPIIYSFKHNEQILNPKHKIGDCGIKNNEMLNLTKIEDEIISLPLTSTETISVIIVVFGATKYEKTLSVETEISELIETIISENNLDVRKEYEVFSRHFGKSITSGTVGSNNIPDRDLLTFTFNESVFRNRIIS